MELENAELKEARAKRRETNWRGGVRAAHRQTIEELERALEQKLRRDLAQEGVPEAYAMFKEAIAQGRAALGAGQRLSREHITAGKEVLRMGGYGEAIVSRDHEGGLMDMTLADLTALVARYEAEKKAQDATIEGELAAEALENLI